jgi:flavin-dependent dehydrogenase
MQNGFDLVVVGGGPGGLAAAKIAAEQGMKVALVEAKKDISKITRTCCQIFYLNHISGGNTYIKPVRIELASGGGNTRLLFPDIDLAFEYSGPIRACYDWRNFSPDGTCVYTAKNFLWGFVFDKGLLLKGLLDDIEQSGVTVLNQTRGIRAENTSAGVKVEIQDSKRKTSFIEARHAIIANGVNSRIVENLGLNKERKPLAPPLRILSYIMEGVECPYPLDSWLSISYPSISTFINLWMGPMADGTRQVAATGKETDSPSDMLQRLLSSPHFSSWFKNATIVSKGGCAMSPRFPIAEPVVGNIFIIGDSAAPAETWVQGALACGHQAVMSILGGDTQKYLRWWKESFAFNTPTWFEEMARYPALNMFFTDEEVDYLYGLIKDQVVSNIPEGVLAQEEIVAKDQPAIHEKLKKVKEIISKSKKGTSN